MPTRQLASGVATPGRCCVAKRVPQGLSRFATLTIFNESERMVENTIAIFEGNSLLDALQAVGTMMGHAKVKLVGRYFLGNEKVATVVKGSAEEISSGIAFVKKEFGNLPLDIGVLTNVPKNILDVMLAPHEVFHPVCTVKEPEPIKIFQKSAKVESKSYSKVERPSTEPIPKVSFENVPGLTRKRKLRFAVIMNYFYSNKNRNITTNDISKARPEISKPALGRDLDYLAKRDLIEKNARGRGTFYRCKS